MQSEESLSKKLYPNKPKTDLANTASKMRLSTASTMTIYALLVLSLFFLESSAQHMIFPQKSSHNFSSIDLTTAHLPQDILSQSPFTVLFEYTIKVPKPVNLAGKVTVLSGFDPAVSESLHVNLGGNSAVLTLQNSNTQLLLNPLHIKDFGSHMRFNFVWSVEVDYSLLTCRAFYHSISAHVQNASASHRKYPVAAKKITRDDQFLFGIRLDAPGASLVLVRNVVALPAPVDPSQACFDRLFGGVATLAQALYLYMEPAFTKTFANRSAFNVPPALNGYNHGYLGGLLPQFSVQTGQVEWLLASGNFEFASWDLPLLDLQEALSTSIWLNLSIFLRNADASGYLATASNDAFFLASLCDSRLEPLVTVHLRIDRAVAQAGHVDLEYSFVLQNGSSQIASELSLSQSVSATDLELDVNALQLVVLAASESSLFVQVVCHFCDARPEASSPVSPMGGTKGVSAMAKLVLGNPEFLADLTHPKFLVSLHDVQVFWGAQTFESVADSELRLAFSKVSIHPVRCRSNSYLNRRSGHPTLDAVYTSQMGSLPYCKDRVFNADCKVPDCELCGESVCVVCRVPFVLSQGLCVDKAAQLATLDYDVFSRASPLVFTRGSPSAEYSIVGDSSKFFQSNFRVVYLHFGFDLAAMSGDRASLRIQYDLHESFLANPNSLGAALRSKLFGNSSEFGYYFVSFCRTTYFYLKNHQHTARVRILRYDDPCSELAGVPTLRNNLRLMFCGGVSDFESAKYFSAGTATVAAGSYLESFRLVTRYDTTFTIAQECRNNCQCSQPNPNSCGSGPACPPGFGMRSFSRENAWSSCEPCPIDCASCSDGLCTRWQPSTVFYTRALTADSGLSSSVQVRFPCHNSCVRGCWGGLKSQCRRCSARCLACDARLDCICRKSTGTYLDRVDTDFNVCFKRKCGDGCEVCSAKGSCLQFTTKTPASNSLYRTSLRPIKNCVRSNNLLCESCARNYYSIRAGCRKCPSNCTDCTLIGGKILVCRKCAAGYSLSPAKLCFRLPIRTNWILSEHVSGASPDCTSLTVSPSHALCESKPLKFANECQTCSGKTLLKVNDSCQACPKMASQCKSSHARRTPKPQQYGPDWHFHPKFAKCAACPDPKCRACDSRTCFACAANSVPHGSHCLECPQGHCLRCSSDGQCTECAPEFFLSLGQCHRCSAFCLSCVSRDLCRVCGSEFVLAQTSPQRTACAPKCSSNRIDPATGACASCDRCKCFDPLSPSESCPDCPKCRTRCRLSIDFPEQGLIRIESGHVLFHASTQVRLVPQPGETSVLVLPDQSLKVRSTRLGLDSFLRVSHESVSMVDCMPHSDFEIRLPEWFVLAAEPSSLGNVVLYGRALTRVVSGASLFLPSQFDLSSLILLLNLNELFLYSIYFGTNDGNILFSVNSVVNRINYSKLSGFPLERLSFLHCVSTLGQHNYVLKEFVSLPLFVCAALPGFALLAYLASWCRSRSKKSTSAKPLPVSRVCKHSRIRSLCARLPRLIRSKQRKLVFVTFQIFSLDLAHLAAQSLKFLKLAPNRTLWFLCCYYHLALCTLAVYSVQRLAHLRSVSQKPATLSKAQCSELGSLSTNLSYTLLNVFVVYSLVAFRRVFEAEYMFVTIFGAIFVHLLAETRLILGFRKMYLMRSSLVSFPVFSILLNLFRVAHPVSLLLGAYFITVEVVGVVLIVFELAAKVNSRIVDSIHQKQSGN